MRLTQGACGKNVVFFTPPHLTMEFPRWTQRVPHAPPTAIGPLGEREKFRVAGDYCSARSTGIVLRDTSRHIMMNSVTLGKVHGQL
jgi:hypothetical protein